MDGISQTTDSTAFSSRFHIVSDSAHDLSSRLVSGTLALAVVDGLHNEPAALSRPGPLLFELRRALRPGGLVLWTTASNEAGSLLNLALRYGFVVPRISVWCGPERSGNLLVLQTPELSAAASQASGCITRLPWSVVVAHDQTARGGWAQVLDVLGADERTGGEPRWVLELAAPDSTVAESCVVRGLSWLGQGVEGRRRGLKADAVRQALGVLQAREALLLPDLLSTPEARENPRDLPSLCPRPAQMAPETPADPAKSMDLLELSVVASAAPTDSVTDASSQPAGADVLALGKVRRPRLGMLDRETPLRRTATG